MSLVETYWEGAQAEMVSPELALVDPVLRERLLSQSPVVGRGTAEPPVDSTPVEPPTPSGGRVRRGRVVAWTSISASCAVAFAIVMFALAQHPSGAHAIPPAGPAVAVVTTYTPPATVTPAQTAVTTSTTVDQRSEADKIRLQVLLRAPMRDPFARSSG
jgi:hypothetical protein